MPKRSLDRQVQESAALTQITARDNLDRLATAGAIADFVSLIKPQLPITNFVNDPLLGDYLDTSNSIE